MSNKTISNCQLWTDFRKSLTRIHNKTCIYDLFFRACYFYWYIFLGVILEIFWGVSVKTSGPSLPVMFILEYWGHIVVVTHETFSVTSSANRATWLAKLNLENKQRYWIRKRPRSHKFKILNFESFVALVYNSRSSNFRMYSLLETNFYDVIYRNGGHFKVSMHRKFWPLLFSRFEKYAISWLFWYITKEIRWTVIYRFWRLKWVT